MTFDEANKKMSIKNIADAPTHPRFINLEYETISKELFTKDDCEKNRLELIDPEFIMGLGRIMTFGAKKYAADNWKLGDSKESQERIKGALLRHIMLYLNGDKIDHETGESHLYHVAFGLQALAYFDRIQEEEI